MKYEINMNTESIIPINGEKTKIYENGLEKIVNINSLKIIERSCEFFGSSLDGRKIGTKSLLGITHKAPIIIEETRKIIFFPTTSPNREDCIWINLDQIQQYCENPSNTSSIIFKKGNILDLDMSIGSLTNQILRASRLKCILEERINNKKDIFI